MSARIEATKRHHRCWCGSGKLNKNCCRERRVGAVTQDRKFNNLVYNEFLELAAVLLD